MDLEALPEQQLRQRLEDMGIITAGLLTKEELLRRYRSYLQLYNGGAKIVKLATVTPGRISAYRITDMRY
jgi:hypothetical protein